MIKYRYSHGMRILFVGINPHFGSFERGVPFSNNKMFWYLLSRAGVINERIEDLRDDAKLRSIYRNKFTQVYRLGFINVIDRPTRDISQLERGEEESGRRRAMRIIKHYRPKVVCFIGKIAFEKFTGLKDFGFGWQADIGESKIFVMHFPLRGKAAIRVEELRLLNAL